MNELGRLVKVDLRVEWQNEAGDFTPWLALPENIALLGETVGLDLEVEATEKEVGPFRADILCKETASDHAVLIENQLEKTDHTHFGQIMTYAAGLDAATIIWVAKQFTEEHRAALDWLNEITDAHINFFGLEVELWRIGDSLPAPKFNVVSSPNSWSRTLKVTGGQSGNRELSETRAKQFEFWTGLKAYLSEHTDLRCGTPYPQGWLNISIGKSGYQIAAVASSYHPEEGYNAWELRAEFVITHTRSEQSFRRLRERRVEIETKFGNQLSWYEKEGVRQRKVYVAMKAQDLNRENWPQYFEWFAENLQRLNVILKPMLADLDAANTEPVISDVE